VPLQGIEEPQRKFFWPADLLRHYEDEDCDDDEEEEEDDEGDLLTVSKYLKF